MCQIFAGKSSQIRSVLLNKPGLLESLFRRNNDGLGAMYATTKKVLRMPKIVPNTLEDARAFIRQLPNDDRNLVIHFRMKTSGKIDHDNAHPFVVLDGTMAMTHNGVLRISTKSDETKCDTRHYIEQFLRPILSESPQLARNAAFLELVGNDIGGNRFVLMDNEGSISYVNYHTGYTFEGMWFANTYSFDAGLLDEQFAPKTYTTGSWNGYNKYPTHSMLDDDWGVDDPKVHNITKKPDTSKRLADAVAAFKTATGKAADSSANTVGEGEAIDAEIWAAVRALDARELARYLRQMPVTTMVALMQACDFVPATVDRDMSPLDEIIVKALADASINDVLAAVDGTPARWANVADAICLYGDWVGKAIDKKDMSLVNDVYEAESEANELECEAQNLTEELMYVPAGSQAATELAVELDNVIDQRLSLEHEVNQYASMIGRAPTVLDEAAQLVDTAAAAAA